MFHDFYLGYHNNIIFYRFIFENNLNLTRVLNGGRCFVICNSGDNEGVNDLHNLSEKKTYFNMT